ncbi:MAG: hypothetical protein V1906_02635 [Candidatus Woesearchaeota archaeon]
MGTKAASGNNNHILSNDDGLEARRAEGIMWLRENRGKHKRKCKPLSPEERDRMAMELTPEDGERLAREFGLTI